MKKVFLVGIIGISLFLTTAKAETIDLENATSTSQVVTVGEVDMPVYSVDITWGDMTYNYSYNDITGEHYWKENLECYELNSIDLKLAYERNSINIYSDNKCLNELSYDKKFEDIISSGVYYTENDIYTGNGGGEITIIDKSKQGQITPEISWASESEYDFVNGKFKYADEIPWSCVIITEEEYNYDYDNFGKPKLYQDSKCLTLTDDEIPSFTDNTYYWAPTGGYGWVDFVNGNELYKAKLESEGEYPKYLLKLVLENDPTKEATMPVKGDTIGTVTITLTAN